MLSEKDFDAAERDCKKTRIALFSLHNEKIFANWVLIVQLYESTEAMHENDVGMPS